MIRPMAPSEEYLVRALYRVCHPTWAERSRYWYFVNPTLVAIEPDEKGYDRVVGFTSFSISTSTGLILAQGADVCVHPAVQGRGLGRELHEARCEIARSVGATVFSGTTQPGNRAMTKILLAQGLHHCQTIPRYFPDGEDALLYFGSIGD